jgi:SAM-dependent methyltransferase
MSDSTSQSSRSAALVERVHGGYVHGRRVERLLAHLAPLIPPGAALLDVGCGDGLLSHRLAERRPDLSSVSGLDVLVRPDTHIPVAAFDGRTIPHSDKSFDAVVFVDVLHHTDDPMVLLREAARVARTAILIKDHTRDGLLAGPTLRFMDRVGNARYGVSLPYNYWPQRRWMDAFDELDLRVDTWRRNLGLYPLPADLVFGRSLHFVARLVPPTGVPWP